MTICDPDGKNARLYATGLRNPVGLALEPLTGIPLMRRRRPRAKRETDLTSGPGKLCAALGITGSLNAVSLQRGPLRIRRGRSFRDSEITITGRIGVTHCADWPLRWN